MLTGCGGNAKREDKELKIGFLGSRQAVSESAPELLWGMETAKEDLNRKYQEQGYTVTVEFFDDRGEKGGAAEPGKGDFGPGGHRLCVCSQSGRGAGKGGKETCQGRADDLLAGRGGTGRPAVKKTSISSIIPIAWPPRRRRQRIISGGPVSEGSPRPILPGRFETGV